MDFGPDADDQGVNFLAKITPGGSDCIPPAGGTVVTTPELAGVCLHQLEAVRPSLIQSIARTVQLFLKSFAIVS